MAERLTPAEVMEEAAVRARVEGELREEMEHAGERDRAIRAVVVAVAASAIVLIPLLALLLGLAVRIFGLASGLY